MQNPITHPKQEPVALGGLVQVLLLALWACVLAFSPRFGFDFTQGEIAAITGLIAAIEVAITFIQRNQAWADDRVTNEFISAEHGLPVGEVE